MSFVPLKTRSRLFEPPPQASLRSSHRMAGLLDEYVMPTARTSIPTGSLSGKFRWFQTELFTIGTAICLSFFYLRFYLVSSWLFCIMIASSTGFSGIMVFPSPHRRDILTWFLNWLHVGVLRYCHQHSIN